MVSLLEQLNQASYNGGRRGGVSYRLPPRIPPRRPPPPPERIGTRDRPQDTASRWLTPNLEAIGNYQPPVAAQGGGGNQFGPLGAGLGMLGKVGLGALDVLDAGRRASVLLQETAANVLPDELEWLSPPSMLINEDRDEDRSAWERFRDPTYGWGQVSKQIDTGHSDLDKWLNRGQGLAGDIALDPLTYLTFGVGAIPGKTGRGAQLGRLMEAQKAAKYGEEMGGAFRALGFTDDAIPEAWRGAEKLAPLLGDEAELTRLGQASVSAANPEQLAAMGLRQHGVRWAGMEIPGSARVSKALSVPGQKLRPVARGLPGAAALREASSRKGYVGQSLHPAYERLITGKGPSTATESLEALRWDEMAREAGGTFEGLSNRELRIFKEKTQGLSDSERAEMVRAAERGEDNVMSQFAATIREAAKEAGGEIPELSPIPLPGGGVRQYGMPHVLSRDFRNYLANAAKGKYEVAAAESFKTAGGIKTKDLLEEGGFLQKRRFTPNDDGTPAEYVFGDRTITIEEGTADELNAKFKALFPEFEGSIYETDPVVAWRRYIQATRKDIANQSASRRAERAGFSDFIRDPGTPARYDPYGGTQDVTTEGETITIPAPNEKPGMTYEQEQFYKPETAEKATRERNKTIRTSEDIKNARKVLAERSLTERTKVATGLDDLRDQVYDPIQTELDRLDEMRKAGNARAGYAMERHADLTQRRLEIPKELDALNRQVRAIDAKIAKVGPATAKRIPPLQKQTLDQLAAQRTELLQRRAQLLEAFEMELQTAPETRLIHQQVINEWSERAIQQHTDALTETARKTKQAYDDEVARLMSSTPGVLQPEQLKHYQSIVDNAPAEIRDTAQRRRGRSTLAQNKARVQEQVEELQAQTARADRELMDTFDDLSDEDLQAALDHVRQLKEQVRLYQQEVETLDKSIKTSAGGHEVAITRAEADYDEAVRKLQRHRTEVNGAGGILEGAQPMLAASRIAEQNKAEWELAVRYRAPDRAAEAAGEVGAEIGPTGVPLNAPAKGDYTRAKEAWGGGQAKFDEMFPGDAKTADSLLPKASEREGAGVVGHWIKEATRDDLVPIDPRTLHTVQQQVTREHLERYLGDAASTPHGKPGSVDELVVVYENAEGRRTAMSGNHRANAAILRGENVDAILMRYGEGVVRPSAEGKAKQAAQAVLDTPEAQEITQRLDRLAQIEAERGQFLDPKQAGKELTAKRKELRTLRAGKPPPKATAAERMAFRNERGPRVQRLEQEISVLERRAAQSKTAVSEYNAEAAKIKRWLGASSRQELRTNVEQARRTLAGTVEEVAEGAPLRGESAEARAARMTELRNLRRDLNVAENLRTQAQQRSTEPIKAAPLTRKKAGWYQTEDGFQIVRTEPGVWKITKPGEFAPPEGDMSRVFGTLENAKAELARMQANPEYMAARSEAGNRVPEFERQIENLKTRIGELEVVDQPLVEGLPARTTIKEQVEPRQRDLENVIAHPKLAEIERTRSQRLATMTPEAQEAAIAQEHLPGIYMTEAELANVVGKLETAEAQAALPAINEARDAMATIRNLTGQQQEKLTQREALIAEREGIPAAKQAEEQALVQTYKDQEAARVANQEIKDKVGGTLLPPDVASRRVKMNKKQAKAFGTQLEAVKAGKMAAHDAQPLNSTLEQIDELIAANPLGDDAEMLRLQRLSEGFRDEMAKLTKETDIPAHDVDRMVAAATKGKLAPVVDYVLQDGIKRMWTGGDILVSDRVYDMFYRVTEGVQSKGFGRLMKLYTDFFKTYATLSPGFHVRNALSAIFMNFTEGVPTGTQSRGLSLWREFANSETPITWLRGQSTETREAFRAVFASGSGGQFFEAGVGELAAGTTRMREGVFQNRLTKGSQRVGQDWVEGPVRLGLALHATEAGGGVADALAKITRVHFDYSQVSNFDEKAKRYIPFWTYMSRNMPLQITQMWTKPKVYAMFNSFKRNFAVPNPEEMIPDYIGQAGGFQSGETPGWWPGAVGMPFVMQPDLPHTRLQEDLARFSQAASGENAGQLLSDFNPAFTAPAEFITGQDFYTGRSYEEDDLTKAGIFDLPMLPIAALLGETQMGPGGLYVSEKARNTGRALIPPYDRAVRMLPQGAGGGGDMDRQLESFLRFLGMPVRTVSEQQMTGEAFSRQRQLRDQQRRMAAVGG